MQDSQDIFYENTNIFPIKNIMFALELTFIYIYMTAVMKLIKNNRSEEALIFYIKQEQSALSSLDFSYDE